MNLWYSMRVLATAAGLAFALGAAQAQGAEPHEIHFQLVPNPSFVDCLARFPGDPSRPPTADVRVTRGKLNDTLRMQLHNIKPGLGFDLFTVQRSPFLADGSKDTSFPGFGLAWYQSDVEAGTTGGATVEIKTILLDQIFGFDPDVTLAPTNSFHVGFWFNNLDDVFNCDPDHKQKATPFNGEHNAGPLAMISLPDTQSDLGPLCTNPDFSTTPPTCNP